MKVHGLALAAEYERAGQGGQKDDRSIHMQTLTSRELAPGEICLSGGIPGPLISTIRARTSLLPDKFETDRGRLSGDYVDRLFTRIEIPVLLDSKGVGSFGKVFKNAGSVRTGIGIVQEDPGPCRIG
jgi:hypothetical protein